MDFDTARLRAFLQVAERGTVAAAADSLGYTAPAVSQQIAKLESQLGTHLFDRVNGRLRLSAAGERLVPVAAGVLDLVDRTASAVTGAAPSGPIAIAGFASSLTEIVLPAFAPGDVPVEWHELEDDDALRGLRLGDVDIAITQEYDLVPAVRNDRFRYTQLARDRLRLIGPPDARRSEGLAGLATRGWLVNGSGTRCEAATTAVLHRAGITPRIVGRVADNRALLQLVAAGVGATIAPELVVRNTGADVTITRSDLGASRTILAVTRAGMADELRPIVQRLADITRRTLP